MKPSAAFWDAENQTLFKLLFPICEEACQVAAKQAVDMLEIDTDISWGLVNKTAREWAKQYTYGMVKGINGTSQAILQSEFDWWISSGLPLDDLIEKLTPYWGPVRAEMIGVTETTRVYMEGNLIGWRASEVVEGVMILNAEDDNVCVICDPTENPPIGEVCALDSDGVPGFGWPPFHVRCRCFGHPVVGKEWLKNLSK